MNDAFARAYYCNNASNRWLGVRLEFIGNVAVGCAALFAVVWNADPATAGMVGLSVTYALDVTGTLNWAIRTFTQMESNMVREPSCCELPIYCVRFIACGLLRAAYCVRLIACGLLRAAYCVRLIACDARRWPWSASRSTPRCRRSAPT